jgi:hypothetical protein
MTTAFAKAVYKRRPPRKNIYIDRHRRRHRCDSLLERQRLKVLDLAGYNFRREPLRIKYLWLGKWEIYRPDLAVYDMSGTRLLWIEEQKPLVLCADAQNLAKWNAARIELSGRRIKFLVIHERTIDYLPIAA